MGVWLARLSRVPYGSKEAWMLTGEDVRVRGQKRRMREEMTLTLTLTLTGIDEGLASAIRSKQPACFMTKLNNIKNGKEYSVCHERYGIPKEKTNFIIIFSEIR